MATTHESTPDGRTTGERTTELPLLEVLVAEYRAQELAPPLDEATVAAWHAQPAGAGVADFYAWLHRHGVRRSALCFSGGGIRSATFALGITQALSRAGLLRGFDYLSTVSGGGYLGGWLTAWIHRLGGGTAAVAEVERALAHGPGAPLEPEPTPVRHLRSYSRYMSPRLGLLSADTWTLVATFVRNLLLNWAVLVPLLVAILMLPRLSLWGIQAVHLRAMTARADAGILGLYWLAVLFGGVAIAYLSVNRPGLGSGSTFPERWRGQPAFLALCLGPLILMSVAATVAWAWLLGHQPDLTQLPLLPGLFDGRVSAGLSFVVFGAVMHLWGFLLARVWVRRWSPVELAVALLTGAAGGGLAFLAARHGFDALAHDLDKALFVCFAGPLLLLFFFLASVLFAGLASHFTRDEDREWLARAGAWILIAVVVRAAFAAIVLFGPLVLVHLAAWTSSIGGLSGLITLYLGYRGGSAGDPAAEKRGPGAIERWALAIAAPIFVLALLATLSLGTGIVLSQATNAMAEHADESGDAALWYPEREYPQGRTWEHDVERPDEAPADRISAGILAAAVDTSGWTLFGLLLVAAVVGGVFGSLVDINRFSLHGAYRERLIRAYLGASRGVERRPNPFTGFDPADNVEMRHLGVRRPFHVLNVALNLVGGKRLGWQDRKATSFTVSPLHAGNLFLGYRGVDGYGRHRRGDRAISLGTAVAISGAAASPNMGYHSSPAVTFLLALFNVRLGWWLGNPGPAGERTYRTPGPRFAPRALFAEAFGLTDDANPYVYLSDGGHFENLGLYEMVLRRCHYIVVADAAADPDYTFGDLANAVAKIRIDFGIPIEFEALPMRRFDRASGFDVATGGGPDCVYGALGRIRYDCVDGPGTPDGLLLYVKPVLAGSEPVDLYDYGRTHADFPMQSTADQLYDERQFESYRVLGSHAFERIVGTAGPPPADLAALFAGLRRAAEGEEPAAAGTSPG